MEGSLFWSTAFLLVLGRCSTGAWSQIHTLALRPRTALLYMGTGLFVNVYCNFTAIYHNGYNTE